MRADEWVLVHWPTTWRRRIAAVVAIVVFVLAALPLVFRVAGFAVDLGILPYVALFILCWVGEGGALVPIPGVRLLSWLTIVQQGANLDPVFVAVVAAVAMACGQSTYFLVARSGSRLVEEHLAVGPLRGRLPIPVPEPAHIETAVVGPGRWIGAMQRYSPWRTVCGRCRAGDRRRPSGRLAGAASTISGRLQAHPRRTIFIVSVLPSPLTTLTTVGAATVGIPFRTFFAAALAGFLVLSSVSRSPAKRSWPSSTCSGGSGPSRRPRRRPTGKACGIIPDPGPVAQWQSS